MGPRTSLRRSAVPAATAKGCATCTAGAAKPKPKPKALAPVKWRHARNPLTDMLARVNKPTKLDAAHVKQGGLGDCYLLSTLGVVAHQHPEKIGEVMKRNKDGTYTVSFRKMYTLVDAPNGKQVVKYLSSTSYNPQTWVAGSTPSTVTFDDVVPTRDGRNLGVQSAAYMPEQTWVALMEKAYAKEYGGGVGKDAYAGIGHGGYADNAFRALGYEEAGNAPASSASFDRMRNGYRNGTMYVVGSKPHSKTEPDLPTEPPRGHAYMVMGFHLAPDGTEMIRLRNPWGVAGKYGSSFALSKQEFLKYYATIYGSEQP